MMKSFEVEVSAKPLGRHLNSTRTLVTDPLQGYVLCSICPGNIPLRYTWILLVVIAN